MRMVKVDFYIPLPPWLGLCSYYIMATVPSVGLKTYILYFSD